MRPRLADARFFFDQDRKEPLASARASLRSVVYHNKLGTQGERVERIALARRQHRARASAPTHALAERAAQLAKADLLTDMVGEFPELQGVMGRYYAMHDGEAQRGRRRDRGALPAALRRRRAARSAGRAGGRARRQARDAGRHCSASASCPPATRIRSRCAAHALGVMRILIEKRLPLAAAEPARRFRSRPFDSVAATKPVPEDVADFMFDRLRGHCASRATRRTRSKRCSSQRPRGSTSFPTQLEAVQAFAALPEAGALAAANKRIGNILKKAAAKRRPASTSQRLTDGAERDLCAGVRGARRPRSSSTARAATTPAALKALASAKPAVDASSTT